jgi:uncharacterized protein YndB with AHSA1/START domain
MLNDRKPMLYKVKKLKAPKSKPAANKAKSPTPVKKAKGKPSTTNVKASKSAKPVKKVVSKAVSKPVKKNVIKKATKPAKPVKAIKPVKKKQAPKPIIKKAVKKVVKSAPAKAVKPVKPVKSIKPTKALKPTKPAKAAKPVKPVAKEEKVKAIKPEKPAKPEKVKPPVADKPLKVKKGKGGRKPKSKNDDDEPEIIHDELIEQIIQTTKRQSKQPKKPRILKTFVNPMTSLTVATDGLKKGAALPKKEPKGKFELEYVVRTSAGILYELLTTPSGLSEWFADDVNIRDGIFTFFWDGSEQKARLLGFKEDKYVRLQWMDKQEGSYFEFRIERDELTGDISLMIVDFADEASDMQTSKLLWDSQVNKLLNVLGSN